MAGNSSQAEDSDVTHPMLDKTFLEQTQNKVYLYKLISKSSTE